MYRKVTLKNGLRVIVAPMKSTRIITVNVFVKNGSRYEKQEENGITHFIEHMLFKGTRKRKDAFAISGEIEGVGGEFNAATGQEYCCFYIKILDKHFEKALEVLSDIMINSVFRQKDMDTERLAIFEEIKMRMDSPGSHHHYR